MSDIPQGANPAAIAQMEESFAVIYAPKRTRKRFAANTVYLKESLDEALQGADEKQNLHAARVCGPFSSSEGMRLFYLVGWL